MAITYNDVVVAIDTLVGRGETPSIPKVRKELGDTGSPNTIQRHLSTWRGAAPVVSRTAIELPDAVKVAVTDAIERQSSLDRSEIDKKLLVANEELGLLSKTGEDLEIKNDDLIEKNKTLTEGNQRLTTLIDERTGELKKVSEEFQTERDLLEKARVGQAESNLKIEALKKDLIDKSDVDSELKKVKEELVETKTTLAVLDSTSKRDTTDIEKLEKSLADSIVKKESAESELKSKVSDLTEKFEEKEKELIEKFEGKEKALQDKFEVHEKDLNEQIKSINEVLLDSKSELSTLKGRLTEIDKPKVKGSNKEVENK